MADNDALVEARPPVMRRVLFVGVPSVIAILVALGIAVFRSSQPAPAPAGFAVATASASAHLPPDAVVVFLSDDGQTHVVSREGSTTVSAPGVAEAVASASGRLADRRVYIRAGGQVRYGRVLEAAQRLSRAGYDPQVLEPEGPKP